MRERSVSQQSAIPAVGKSSVGKLWLFGSYRINTDGRPPARPLKLVYTMTFHKDVEHTWGKVVVGAVFQDDIDV